VKRPDPDQHRRGWITGTNAANDPYQDQRAEAWGPLFWCRDLEVDEKVLIEHLVRARPRLTATQAYDLAKVFRMSRKRFDALWSFLHPELKAPRGRRPK
jgi:hypothetical protein